MNSKSALATIILTTTLVCAFSSLSHAEDGRDTVRSSSGDIIVNSFGNCVRTVWNKGVDDCAPGMPAGVTIQEAPRKHREIAREERTIYFDFNKTTLSADAKRKLDSLASILKSENNVREAHIVGYADRIGSAGYNQKLSQKRAENVKKYILFKGYAHANVADTRWFGENYPVSNCPGTLSHKQLISCLQKDRRVEVEIDYSNSK